MFEIHWQYISDIKPLNTAEYKYCIKYRVKVEVLIVSWP